MSTIARSSLLIALSLLIAGGCSSLKPIAPEAGYYLYGVHAEQPLGATVRGSYNRFLNQGCKMLMVNSAASTQTATISMVRYDGTVVLAGQGVTIPAHGTAEFNACAVDGPNTLGVVTMVPQTRNTIYATVVRSGDANRYRFPTPVR